jgi:hypothetical protein
MKRRNQARRRRAYGRRQHEVRQRRPDERMGASMAWYDEGADGLDSFGMGHQGGSDAGQGERAAA